MRRRVRVVGADDALELAQHPCRGVLGRADDRKRAGALAVEREALGVAGRDEEVEAGVEAEPDRARVLDDAVAEALVRHVEEGHQAARREQLDHLRPLLGREVAAGRVVAAGVQDDDRPGRRRRERGAHRREVDAFGRRVVVRVGADLEAGALEQGAVVLPARLADQDRRCRIQALQQVGADLQAAGAADRLDGRDPPLAARRRVAEDERLGRRVVGGDAVDRQVAARLRRFHHHLLGLADAAKQRQLAVLVVVDADAEVHLARVGVGDELLVQAQDRVAGAISTASKSEDMKGFLRVPLLAKRAPGAICRHRPARPVRARGTACLRYSDRPPSEPRQPRNLYLP